MQDNGTGIHWHGMRQLNSVGMDGVPGITECETLQLFLISTLAEPCPRPARTGQIKNLCLQVDPIWDNLVPQPLLGSVWHGRRRRSHHQRACYIKL